MNEESIKRKVVIYMGRTFACSDLHGMLYFYEKICEIIDFAEYLKAKELKENRSLIDSLVDEYDEALKELAK